MLDEPDASQEWFLELQVGPYRFDEVLICYQQQDMLLVPLDALAQMIDLAITTYPGDGRARGFVFNEKHGFDLDLTKQIVTLNGVEQPLDISRVKAYLTDIYVDAELLQQWLPLKLDVDLYASRIYLIPDEKLPFQQRLDRESRIKRTMSHLKRPKRELPSMEDKYLLWEMPSIDQTFRTGIRKGVDGAYKSSLSYSTLATADLMRMNSSWYLAGSDVEPLSTFRVFFSRMDVDGDLLGPLQAREYSFGHINEPKIGLINSPSKSDAGVLVSNYPLQRQLQYHSHSFIGDLAPGWEVEIYRNNSLVGYQTPTAEGQYRFEAIPLLFGTNHFRLVFYGPQGQTREEEKRFELGNSMTSPGQHYYRVSVSEDTDGGTRSVAQYDVGLQQNLSASLSLTSVPIAVGAQRTNHNYFYTGLQTSWEALYANIGVVSDSDGGKAAELHFQSRWDDFIIGGSDTHLQDFVSEEQAGVSRRTKLRIDTSIPPGYFSRIPLNFEWLNERYESGTERRQISNEISYQQRGITANNHLTWSQYGSEDYLVNGRFQLSGTLASYRLRGDSGYQVTPDFQMESLAATIEFPRVEGAAIRTSLNRHIINSTTQLSAGANTMVSNFLISADTSVDNLDNFVFNLSLSFALGQEPRKGTWHRTPTSMARNGALSVDVFLDENQNGVHDDGENGLESAGLIVNGARRTERTSDDGIGFVPNMMTWRETDIEIALETLEDPLLMPSSKGITVTPRHGHITLVDFPVVMTGEIDGFIHLERGEAITEMSMVEIELLN
ncbi:MAG: hypothetical protein GQ470_02155, partial [Gammaproteobacteria bacterium]|nr:hypothetical protein [Gammaproteobacteria bacterium]